MITTTLENLPQVIRENRIRELATVIVKYQNFKTCIIMAKAAYLGYARGSLGAYIQFGLEYLNEGLRNKKGGKLFDFIDEVLAKHIQPLTPAINEQRTPYKPKKRTSLNISPQKTTSSVSRVISSLINVQYAV